MIERTERLDATERRWLNLYTELAAANLAQNDSHSTQWNELACKYLHSSGGSKSSITQV